MNPPSIPLVRLSGLLENSLNRAVQRLQAPPYSPLFIRSDVTFEMPRIFNAYSGDVSGRYIEFFSIYAQMGFSAPGLDDLVQRVLSAQMPDGYFGEPGFNKTALTEKETKIFWGNGRLLIGLLEYYRLTQSSRVLEAARKMGDFLVSCQLHKSTSSIGQGVSTDLGAAGFATTFCSCLEGIVRLHEETGDNRYLDLAEGVASLLPEELDGFHSHGRMTALRGVVALASVTGNSAQLDGVVRIWERIQREQTTPLGGMRETFGCACTRDEGCSVADWLMLSLNLFSLRGENRFRQAAEHCLLNHLLTNQYQNGGFGHRAFLLDGTGEDQPQITGIGRKDPDSAEAYWCCSLHGPRALLETARHVATVSAAGTLNINLLVPARVTVAGLSLQISVDDYAQTICLRVLDATASSAAIQVTLPDWSCAPSASLITTHSSPQVLLIGSELVVERVWCAGDELRLDLHPRFEVRPAYPRGQVVERREKEALFFGPFLLGYDPCDDLLWGQGLQRATTTATVLSVPDRPISSLIHFPHKMIVEYHDRSQQRTIWSGRVFVPTCDRLSDQAQQTVHCFEERSWKTLSPSQQEELSTTPVA